MRPAQVHIYLEFSKFGRVKKNGGFMPPFPGAAADLCTLKLCLLSSVLPESCLMGCRKACCHSPKGAQSYDCGGNPIILV